METGGPLTARLREFPGSASGYGWREHPGSGRVPAPARHPITKLTGPRSHRSPNSASYPRCRRHTQSTVHIGGYERRTRQCACLGA